MVKNPFGGGFCRIRRRRFLPTLHISRRLFAGVRAHKARVVVVVVCVENDDDDDAFPRSNFECVFFLRPSVAGRRTLTTTKDDDDFERVRREEDDGNETKRIIPATLFYARERRQKEHAEE